MRFLLTLGRVTLFDFTLFRIEENPEDTPDVVVVHHYHDPEDEDKSDGPDMFGGKS